MDNFDSWAAHIPGLPLYSLIAVLIDTSEISWYPFASSLFVSFHNRREFNLALLFSPHSLVPFHRPLWVFLRVVISIHRSLAGSGHLQHWRYHLTLHHLPQWTRVQSRAVDLITPRCLLAGFLVIYRFHLNFCLFSVPGVFLQADMPAFFDAYGLTMLTWCFVSFASLYIIHRVGGLLISYIPTPTNLLWVC